jgi:hypothetical protein
MLSVLMPSRGRPKDCQQAYDSALSTAKGEVEILVYLDEDDPTRKSYETPHTVGPARRCAQANRELLKVAKGDLFYFGSDDQRWETPGWDTRFAELMPEDGLSILYPRDIKDGQKGMNPVWSRKFADLFGHYPKEFVHFGPDTWLIDIGRRAGTLINVKDVLITHKKLKDETYHSLRQINDASFAQKRLMDTEGERQKIAEQVKLMRMPVAAR